MNPFFRIFQDYLKYALCDMLGFMFRSFLTLRTKPSLRIRSETFREALVTRGITASTACVWHGISPRSSGTSFSCSSSCLDSLMVTGGSDLALSKSTRSMTFLAPKFKVGGNVNSLIWFDFLLNFTSINVFNVKLKSNLVIKLKVQTSRGHPG